MRRSLAFRLAAWVAAVVLSLSTPGLALAHGMAHDHLARQHRGHQDEHHTAHRLADAAPHGHPASAVAARGLDDHDAGEIEPAEHAHGHDHATVDVAPGTRDPGRLDLTVGYSVPAAALPLPTTDVVVRSAARSDRALLARPDPRAGPPPRLRAPPAR